MNADYLSQLNDAQRAAVEYLGGPELVIAGAGSGKTRVLTYKIVHLLHCGYDARHILALTFTNKAAREMRERIEALAGTEVAAQLWMGTFHSIFSRILRRHADRIGYPSSFTIYDTTDSKSLIKSIIKELNLDDKLYTPGAVLSAISLAKNNLLTPEAYAADRDLMQADESARRGRTAEIYAIYVDRCRIAGVMDFDDLLCNTYRLLADNADIRAFYQDYFSYILVDEYQDTNFAQHQIMLQLCGRQPALCVVGDDAQSIYSFRGANIRNILDMRKTFAGLATFKLEENYRSTRNIIGAANTLIAANTEQIRKEVFSNRSEGDRIEVMCCFNDIEEAYSVADRLNRVRMKLGLRYNDVAILYRTNAQSRPLEEALRGRNIPYRIYGGLAFYARREIKDSVAYFRLAVNPDDDEAFRRAVNTSKRGIGDTTVKKLLAAAIASKASMYAVALDPGAYGLSVNQGTAKKLLAFAELIRGFNEDVRKGKPASEVARRIIEETGLMREYESDKTPENVSKYENMLELVTAVDNFVSTAQETDSSTGMSDFLAGVSLLTDQDVGSDDGDCVTLMTIHAAKGLEFGIVFVVGVEDDIIPSSRSSHNISAIEEERRLMYVAITRAKNYCMVTYTRQRMLNGKYVQSMPSRFLHDIERKFLRPVQGADLGIPPRQAAPRFRRDDGPYTDSRTGAGISRVAVGLQPTPERPAPQPGAQRAEAQPSRVAVGLQPTAQRPTPQQPAPPRAAAPASGDYAVHKAAELNGGMRIAHPTFGLGVIRDIDTSRADDRIVVEFSSDGTRRTLLLKFARFKILS